MIRQKREVFFDKNQIDFERGGANVRDIRRGWR